MGRVRLGAWGPQRPVDIHPLGGRVVSVSSWQVHEMLVQIQICAHACVIVTASLVCASKVVAVAVLVMPLSSFSEGGRHLTPVSLVLVSSVPVSSSSSFLLPVSSGALLLLLSSSFFAVSSGTVSD